MPILQVQPSEDGLRLDDWLRGRFPNLPASLFFGLFKKKQIKRNGVRIEAKDRLIKGDEIQIFNPRFDVGNLIEPQKDPLENCFLAREDGFWVINKPAGMAVHPGAGQVNGSSLIERLADHGGWSDIPHLVHRLDQGTSGLILVALQEPILKATLEALQNHRIRKQYLALVQGNPGLEGEIDDELENGLGKNAKVQVGRGKRSRTIWKSIQVWDRDDQQISLVQVEPWTGRMHQIRAHFQHIGHPLLGDPRYGDFALNARLRKELGLKRMFLHAWKLEWHDVGQWEAPLPTELSKVIDHLNK